MSPGNLCLLGLLVLVDPFWGRKRRNWGAAAPDKCNELSVLSSLGRMLFLTNTEDTSPSRWRTTTHMTCSYSAHPAMPSPITMTTTSSSSWLRSLGPPLAPRKVCVSWRTLCAGKCARGREPCWMQAACLTPEGQSCCKASRTSITHRQSLQRCSRQQLVWKPGIASPCRLDVRFIVIYIAFLTDFLFIPDSPQPTTGLWTAALVSFLLSLPPHQSSVLALHLALQHFILLLKDRSGKESEGQSYRKSPLLHFFKASPNIFS